MCVYLMKEQNGFMPNYLACIDVKSQILQFHEEMDQLDIPCFFNFRLRHKFSKKRNQNFIFQLMVKTPQFYCGYFQFL